MSGKLKEFGDSAPDYLQNRLDEPTKQESQLLLEEFVSAFCEYRFGESGKLFAHSNVDKAE